ncbi:CAP domain-containing protein [Aspergillus multicolor]|uniref:putative extracellular SCP domain protein Pry1 n=1 Tax=Aspergillus multicolor TaxID=41759 RepID=UPI003CCCFFED
MERLTHRHHQRSIPPILAILQLLTTALLFLPHATSAAETTVVVTVIETATATASTLATATPEVPQDPSYTSEQQFRSSILETTNTYRAAHNASDLSWNNTLADFAKDWAEGCKWEHSSGPYGENLAYGYTDASAAVTAWADEAALYDFSKPTGFTEETGHFTQLVWKSTKQVGCAAVDCGLTDLDDDEDKERERAQGWYVVCEYVPGGNVIGAKDKLEYFRLNVQDSNGDGDGEDEDSGSGGSAGLGRGALGWSILGMGWWTGVVLYMLS